MIKGLTALLNQDFYGYNSEAISRLESTEKENLCQHIGRGNRFAVVESRKSSGKIICNYFHTSSADLLCVIGPLALPPVPVATCLGGQQMKKRIAITVLA